MKRARYAVTAAAFLPAALGAALPTAAQAAPAAKSATAAKATTATKSVKMQHSAMGAAPLGPCVAVSPWEETYNSPSFLPEMSGFYTPGNGSVCIGTVHVQRYFLHKNCASIELNVYTPVDQFTYTTGKKQICGNAGSEKELTFTIRQKFRAFGDSTAYINLESTYFNGNMVQFWPLSGGGFYGQG